MSPVPSSFSSDESVVATVVVPSADDVRNDEPLEEASTPSAVDSQEVSQSLFSQEEQSQSEPPPGRPPESPPDPVTPPSGALSDQSSPSVDQSPPPEPVVSLGASPLGGAPSISPASIAWCFYVSRLLPGFGGLCGPSAHLSHDICFDRASFELNRFVMYHHRGCQRPAKTPSTFDALRGETVVVRGTHKIPPATFVPP